MPTCTDTGLSEGIKCAVCGQILTPQTVVPAAGHVYEAGVCVVCGAPEPTPADAYSVFNGYKWIAFGDSITAGLYLRDEGKDYRDDANYAYPAVISQLTGIEAENHAGSGTGWAVPGAMFRKAVEKQPADGAVDIVTFMGSVNDTQSVSQAIVTPENKSHIVWQNGLVNRFEKVDGSYSYLARDGRIDVPDGDVPYLCFADDGRDTGASFVSTVNYTVYAAHIKYPNAKIIVFTQMYGAFEALSNTYSGVGRYWKGTTLCAARVTHYAIQGIIDDCRERGEEQWLFLVPLAYNGDNEDDTGYYSRANLINYDDVLLMPEPVNGSRSYDFTRTDSYYESERTGTAPASNVLNNAFRLAYNVDATIGGQRLHPTRAYVREFLSPVVANNLADVLGIPASSLPVELRYNQVPE